MARNRTRYRSSQIRRGVNKQRQVGFTQGAMQLAKRLHREQDGMMVWGLIVCILFFLVLTAFVYNSGKTVIAKVETQNAADAMAYSGSVWTARSLNTITATNHLMGELDALYVLHHALGGRHLDQKDSENDGTWEMNSLDISLALAAGNLGRTLQELLGINLGPLSRFGLHSLPVLGHEGFDEIMKGTFSDLNSSIFQAKLVLRIRMLVLYLQHDAKLADLISTTGQALVAAGSIIGLPLVPGLVAKIVSIINDIRDLRRQENDIANEYQRLTQLERVAQGMRGFKRTIPSIMSTLYGYQKALVNIAPTIIRESTTEIASQHEAEGFVTGQGRLLADTPLPVEPEPGYRQLPNEEHSQLIRATYPWVTHWRKPIGPVLTAMSPRSFVALFYANWTERYTLQSCEWMRTPTSRKYKDELTSINYRNSRHRSLPTVLDDLLRSVSSVLTFVLGKPSQGNGENGRDIRLFVLSGLNEVNAAKGKEAWNDDRNRRDATLKADHLFCQFAAARTQKQSVASGMFFRQENPQGFACVAQSMVYNANEKSMMTGGGGVLGLGKDRQPRVTWDTLNWVGFVPEYEKTWIATAILGSVADIFQQGISQPEIRLNWQAKLTPVTRIRMARGFVTARQSDPQSHELLSASLETLLTLQNH